MACSKYLVQTLGRHSMGRSHRALGQGYGLLCRAAGGPRPLGSRGSQRGSVLSWLSGKSEEKPEGRLWAAQVEAELLSPGLRGLEWLLRLCLVLFPVD